MDRVRDCKEICIPGITYMIKWSPRRWFDMEIRQLSELNTFVACCDLEGLPAL